jgi:Ca-activated chloride channel homolog
MNLSHYYIKDRARLLRLALMIVCSISLSSPEVIAQENPSPKAPTQVGDHLITHTDVVTLNVTVTDRQGRYVKGLDKNVFSVFDEGKQQDILFFSDDDAPVSVGIVFDLSGSMSGTKVGRAREALARFMETSHSKDEYFLIGFNQRAQLLLDRTRDDKAVLDKLSFVETKGQTALYDACYLGIEKVSRGAHQKRALIVLSDGQDNNSRYTFNEVRRLLKESDVLIYGIGILGNDAGSSLGIGGQAILDEMCAVSGGRAFYPNTSAEMNEIFERIALELRHQYSIGYKPTDFTSDGKWRRIKVKVKPPRGLPSLQVRSKEGYYAVANSR